MTTNNDTETIKNESGLPLLEFTQNEYSLPKDYILNKLFRNNDEELDITEFGVMSNIYSDNIGDLIFYAYKELKRLRSEIELLKEIEKDNE